MTYAGGLDVLSGGGEMGARLRAHDWSASPLGPPETWSPRLETLVGVMLGSNQPMFVAWGPQRTLLYNDAYGVLLGRKHPDALGRPFLEVWSEAQADLTPLVERAFAGEPVHMDNITLTLERHGRPEEAHFAFSYTPVRDGGIVAGLFCACTETTGQVIAERRRVAEFARLHDLFRQAPGFMAMLRGPEHVFELTNPAFMRLIGSHEVIGRPAREALPEIEGQGLFELLDQVYRTGEAYSEVAAKVALQRAPGDVVEERFVDFVFQPMTDAKDRVFGVFIEGADVTGRVNAEAELRASEALSRQIMDSASDYAIVAADLDGRITRWNRGAELIFGWREADVMGDKMHRFFTPEDVTAGQPETEMRLAQEQGYATDERWHMRRGGERFWANGAMTPLRDGAGQAVGFVKVLRDRTERRLTEQALRESEFAVSADRRFRSGPDVGHATRSQARVRQSGLRRVPRAVLRGSGRVPTGASPFTPTTSRGSTRRRSRTKPR